jgi:hypothetical protein
VLQHPRCRVTRRVEQINVSFNVREPQQWRTRLSRTQMFAGPANE